MARTPTEGDRIPLVLIHGALTYAFVNTFSPEDAAAAYERYACAGAVAGHSVGPTRRWPR